MGTQQILLIVFSIIIIGIAVAVGISMFNNQSENADRQAVISELDILATVSLTVYKIHKMYGGSGGVWDLDDIGHWLGGGYDFNADSLHNDVGDFGFSSEGDILTIVGLGSETGNDDINPVQATTLVTGKTRAIDTTIDN